MRAEVANMRLVLLVLAVLATGTTAAANEPQATTSRPKAAPAPPAKRPANASSHAPNPELLPLPTFAPCASKDHPLLPAKWEAVALMQDFFQQSFTVGRFAYDESAKAFRFSLVDPFGVDEDRLVTSDGKLYGLDGGDTPTSCTLLTASSPYTVPTRDWLDQRAVCVGQAPILQRGQEWWKSPSGAGANWYWYNAANRLPFRSMYYADAKPTTPVPVYEHFTFNYFPTFKRVASTNLAQIVSMCQKGSSTPTATAEYSRPTIAPLLKKSTYPVQKADGFPKIAQWIPGVSACSSKASLPPPWPDRVQGTVFMTAVSFPPNPFPTRVFYDWTQRSQNTTLNNYPQTAENGAQTALLLGNTGYIALKRLDGSISKCEQVLPGPQVANWKEVDGCECRAQIAPHTVLNPSDVPTKILWCPTDLSAKQVFWTWYSDKGTPVVFMQSNSSPTDGTGLNLADYYHWKPGSVAPAGTFDLSPACQGQPVIQVPKACHNCHLPLNPKK
jgi:hypothetical protein